MPKINPNLSSNYSILFPILLIGIGLLFTLLEPKVSSLLFQWKRQLVLQNFEASIKANQLIDPKTFWKFREFYSPGSFQVNKKGFSQTISQSTESNIPVIFDKNLQPVIFYTSPRLVSVDFLTTSPQLLSFITIPKQARIVFQKRNEILYTIDKKTVITMLLPISKMQEANGFFDYTGDDKQFLIGKYWLTVSEITAD